MASDRVRDDFRIAMLNIYTASEKLGYQPKKFRTMVNRDGAKETADTLLAMSTTSSGFTELFLLGHEAMKLSVEYLVLQRPWRELFDESQLEIARRRLRDVECDLPPDDLVIDPAKPDEPKKKPETKSLKEGTKRQRTITSYDRNPEARDACIEHYGTACSICGFDFGGVYGPLADGFIHVHHLSMISEAGGERGVDPIKDLRPVCANCHEVIHLGGGCRSIEEVKKMMAEAKL
jgi:hypothetical protein